MMPLKSLKNWPKLLNYHFSNAIFRKKASAYRQILTKTAQAVPNSERGGVARRITKGAGGGGEGEGVIIPIGPKGKQAG